MKVLLYGSTGWIGGYMKEYLKEHEVIGAKTRLEDYANIGKELDEVKPTHLLLAGGKTGRPNIDWCETHKIETLETNTIGTAVLASECARRGIHLTYVGTGCIYEYDVEHSMGGKGFTEEDTPNFDKSYYSYGKIITEKILKEYDNVLILRIRMPISSDLHSRSFVTKITKYEKVVNIPNSMTILEDLLPLVPDMMEKNKTGIYNFCNPGVISHNEILDLYREYIDTEFKYTNFTLEEQAKVIVAPRSNNCLDVGKLLREYPGVVEIKEGMRRVFEKMRENIRE